MVLVDTSLWIEVFKRPPGLELPALADLDEIVTCLPIVQEVLQGFRLESAFQVARDAMLSFPLVEAPLTASLFLDAVAFLRNGRVVATGGHRELLRRSPDYRYVVTRGEEEDAA